MQYEKLYDEFKNLFPEDIDRLDELAKTQSAEPTDGMHIMFGMVVVPFLIELLSENESEKLKVAFEFLEKMAKSKDTLIAEVLEFSVLEDFISQDKKVLNMLKGYMGPETLESCVSLEKFFN